MSNVEELYNHDWDKKKSDFETETKEYVVPNTDSEQYIHEMKGSIPKLNAVSKTMEGLLALCNLTVGPIAAVLIHWYGIEIHGKIVQLSLCRGELSHHCRRVVPP